MGFHRRLHHPNFVGDLFVLETRASAWSRMHRSCGRLWRGASTAGSYNPPASLADWLGKDAALPADGPPALIAVESFEGPAQSAIRGTQSDLVRGKYRERDKGLHLVLVQFPRFVVNDAERSQRKPIGVDRRHAGIGPKFGAASHRRVVREPCIKDQVLYGKHTSLQDGVVAECPTPRSVWYLKPIA